MHVYILLLYAIQSITFNIQLHSDAAADMLETTLAFLRSPGIIAKRGQGDAALKVMGDYRRYSRPPVTHGEDECNRALDAIEQYARLFMDGEMGMTRPTVNGTIVTTPILEAKTVIHLLADPVPIAHVE